MTLSFLNIGWGISLVADSWSNGGTSGRGTLFLIELNITQLSGLKRSNTLIIILRHILIKKTHLSGFVNRTNGTIGGLLFAFVSFPIARISAGVCLSESVDFPFELWSPSWFCSLK